MCHFPLTMALSLSSSLPPPALSPYLFQFDWTYLWNCYSCPCSRWVCSSSELRTLLASRLSREWSIQVLCIPAGMSVKLQWWQRTRSNVVSLQKHRTRYRLRPSCPDINLPTLVRLWSLHQTQLVHQSDSSFLRYWSGHLSAQKIPSRELTGSQDGPTLCIWGDILFIFSCRCDRRAPLRNSDLLWDAFVVSSLFWIITYIYTRVCLCM